MRQGATLEIAMVLAGSVALVAAGGCGGRSCDDESRSTGMGGSLFPSSCKKKPRRLDEGAGGAPEAPPRDDDDDDETPSGEGGGLPT